MAPWHVVHFQSVRYEHRRLGSSLDCCVNDRPSKPLMKPWSPRAWRTSIGSSSAARPACKAVADQSVQPDRLEKALGRRLTDVPGSQDSQCPLARRDPEDKRAVIDRGHHRHSPNHRILRLQQFVGKNWPVPGENGSGTLLEVAPEPQRLGTPVGHADSAVGAMPVVLSVGKNNAHPYGPSASQDDSLAVRTAQEVKLSSKTCSTTCCQ